MSYGVKRFLVIAGIFSLAVVGMLALGSLKPPVPTRPEVDTAPLVEVLELSPGRYAFTVASRGTATPVTQTTLSAEVAGTIVGLADAFVAGGGFSAGELLMTIDPTNYEVAVARAEASVSQRQIEYDGAKKLREQGYRAEAELLSAKAALESAKADLVRAQRDLDRTKIRVPYDGIVRARQAELGDYVAPGSPLGTVFATDRMEVRLPLPDVDLAFVELPSIGASDRAMPSVTLSGQYRGKPVTWHGQIVRTEGVVDEATRMVFAVASVEDPYLRYASEDTMNTMPLPAGTFVSADIAGIEVDKVVRIPRSLIRGNDQVVFV
ncbi:MAG: efflux RND transporter periplasmic adaptor subunit, partial [Pseudomonadota bacterium]